MRKAINFIVFLFALFLFACSTGNNSTNNQTPDNKAKLVAIDLSPESIVSPVGGTWQVKATGVYSDGKFVDLTKDATWYSSSESVATVDNTPESKGIVTTIAPGTSSVTATFNGVTSSISAFEAQDPASVRLNSIIISGGSNSLPLNSTTQYKAIGLYSNGSAIDLTTSVTWQSSTPSVASVSNSVSTKGLVSTLVAGSTAVSATFSGVSSNSLPLSVTNASLTSIVISSTMANSPVGVSSQFSALGVYSDGTTLDITNSVNWVSSAPTIADINSSGLLTALSAGSTNITATLAGVTSNTQVYTVTSSSLTTILINAPNTSLPVGITTQYTATGIYSDGSTADITNNVVWTSSSSSIASISNSIGSHGLATALSAGSSSITATQNSVTSSVSTLTVSAITLNEILISSTTTTTPTGTTVQYTATGVYSSGTTLDITNDVTWLSSNPAVASISNNSGSHGLLTAISGGSTVISATLNSVNSNNSNFTVTTVSLNQLVISSSDNPAPLGVTSQFTALGVYSDGSTTDLTDQVLWTSSNTGVATISNASGSRGLATPIITGNTNIQASFSGVFSNTIDFNVNAAILQSISFGSGLANISSLGFPVQYTAIGSYSDGSTHDLTSSVTWTSSNTSVVTISNTNGSKGLATPVAASGVTFIGFTGFGFSSQVNLSIDYILFTYMAGNSSVNLVTQPLNNKGVPQTFSDRGNRMNQVIWLDNANNLWVFGGEGYGCFDYNPSCNSNSHDYGDFNDLWKYDISADQWTWVSGDLYASYTFGTYGTKGVPSINNIPGSRTSIAGNWLDNNGNLWLYGGGEINTSYATFGDLWRYNTTTEEWTWVSGSSDIAPAPVFGTKGIPDTNNFPGGRQNSVSWKGNDGTFWLFGGLTPSGQRMNDLWNYNPVTNEWVWVSGSNQPDQTGVYGTKMTPNPNNIPGSRQGATGWVDASGNLWLFGGIGYATDGIGSLNDLWRYNTTTGEWVWISGSNLRNSSANFGIQGIPNPSNTPGGSSGVSSWITADGKLWLFNGSPYSRTGAALWSFDPVTNIWTWVRGSSSVAFSTYGTRKVENIDNIIGTRGRTSTVSDSSGNVWLFGGFGYNAASDGILGDLWRISY